MRIAFDLDGTLISCAQRQSALLRSIANALRIECDSGAIWELKRNGASTEAALLQAGVDAALAKQIAQRWLQQIEEPYWLSLDRLLDGSRAVLSGLRKEGHRLILLTARRRADLALLQLAQLGLAPLFEQIHVVAPQAAQQHKAAQLAAGAVQLLVGDTESDFQAAALAGVAFCGVTTGQRNAGFLQAQGVQQIVSTLQDAVINLTDRSSDAR